MVLDFPVSDSLHLIDLGIMKRCVLGWRDGSFNGYKTKWRAADIMSITYWLQQCKLPAEIHRAVRGLDTVAFWKASEFRTFLYYLGIVVLQKHLQPDAYDHFLVLFCAVTICSSESYGHLLSIAQELFDTYIEYYKDIYGEAHMTSNVHNLCHVVEEVRRFGVLSSFNAYPFENTLHHIKRLLRTGHKPLHQAAKRIIEKTYMEIDTHGTSLKTPRPRKKLKTYENFDYSLLNLEVINKAIILFHDGIDLQNFSLINNASDCWFFTENNDIVKLRCVVAHNNNYFLFGTALKNKNLFFERPILSSHLNIFLSDLQCVDNSLLYSINEIKCKLVSISYDLNKSVFIPLIHTIK